MLQDNLKFKMHKDNNFSGGYKVHYMDVLRGLLKRILNEKKQDFKVKGEIEAKIAKMWTNKHKDLKSQKNDRINMTAAELAAVKIIENWMWKMKKVQNSKEVTKKTGPGIDELKKFKEA